MISKSKKSNVSRKVETKTLKNSNKVKIDKLIALIELYNKAFNTYVVLKFRTGQEISNEKSLIKLSDKIITITTNKMVKKQFNSFYIEDKKEIEASSDRKRVLFSLRQKTTKVIKHLLLKGKESRYLMDELVELLNKKKDVINNQTDYEELIGKCNLIYTLLQGSPSEPKETIEPGEDGLDILRYKTNMAIYSVASNKKELASEVLKECFEMISKSLDKINMIFT
jgi:hypothetical protein